MYHFKIFKSDSVLPRNTKLLIFWHAQHRVVIRRCSLYHLLLLTACWRRGASCKKKNKLISCRQSL